MNQQRKTPIRTCVSCRTSSVKRELVRIVRTVGGEVRVDPTGKMPGRGAYLCGAKECLALALKANKLGRALRCEIPPRLREELENLVVRDRVSEERRGEEDLEYGS